MISLQGGQQAGLIQDLLLARLGPEEFARRQLVCGDAYAFQGDERDVIFLSLVAAPSEGPRIGPLASARDERRFNVAASRARDQMWLFHTATLQELRPSCMRHRLLAYCLNPKVEPTMIAGLTTTNGELDPRFDSPFEQQVCAMIQDRGYRVIPQVEFAGYRINLVVDLTAWTRLLPSRARCRVTAPTICTGAALARMGPRLKSVFNKAVYRGIQRRRLVDRNEYGTQGHLDNIVRVAGTPPVVPRERGERTLDEIPPSEVGAALKMLAEATGRSLLDQGEEVYRELLVRYGLERFPASDWQNRILQQSLTFVDAQSAAAGKQKLRLFDQSVDR